MDRNSLGFRQGHLGSRVASREGGVDRNNLGGIARDIGNVASREGGVDRN